MLTTYKYQYSINFQYHFGITAFLMYAMLLNLPDLRPIPRRRLLAFGAAAGLCLYVFTVIPKYNAYTDQWDAKKEEYRSIEAILDTIPEDVSLCAPSTYLAHVADRREVYELSYHLPKESHLKEFDVDFAVLRKTRDNKYREMLEKNGYTLWADHGEIVILKSPGAEAEP